MQLQTLFAEVLPNNRLPAQQVTSVTCDSRQCRRAACSSVSGELWATGTTMWRRRCKGERSLWWHSRIAKSPISCWWRTPVGCIASCAQRFWLPSQKDAAAGIDRHQWQNHQCWMLHHALGHLGIKAGLIGTICNRIGESLTLPARYTTPDAGSFSSCLP